MKNIKIKWLTDYHDCETCGCSYAEGAVVTIDGETVVERVPIAHCFDGANYDQFYIFQELFNKLGYNLEEENEYTT